MVSKASLLGKVVVALGASQASEDDVGVDSSKCPHSLGFTFLRMEFLRIRRLAQPSFQSGGRSWGLLDLCLSSLPPRWYPHVSKTFWLPSSYKLRELDHLFVYVKPRP